MRGDTSSDGYHTLDNHPTDRQKLGQTGLLEESSRRTNLHGHVVKVAPTIKLLGLLDRSQGRSNGPRPRQGLNSRLGASVAAVCWLSPVIITTSAPAGPRVSFDRPRIQPGSFPKGYGEIAGVTDSGKR